MESRNERKMYSDIGRIADALENIERAIKKNSQVTEKNTNAIKRANRIGELGLKLADDHKENYKCVVCTKCGQEISHCVCVKGTENITAITFECDDCGNTFEQPDHLHHVYDENYSKIVSSVCGGCYANRLDV